mgnify:FL=1
MSLIKELQRKKILQQKIPTNKNYDDLIFELKEKGIINKKILDSMKKVPRKLFVEDGFADFVYENTPLPILCKQTISQPFIVAYMIDCLKLKETDKVLEIGTGTGYQAALLSHLCSHVYTIEIFDELHDQAKLNHKKLKLENISYMVGNGIEGWRKSISFDAIIISASTKFTPNKLLKNLKNDGKLIFPKKYPLGYQKLILINKTRENIFNEEILLDVKFVPLLEKI